MGFLLSSLGDDDLSAALIDQAIAFYEKGNTTDILAFTQNPGMTRRVPPFAFMNIAEAWGYEGVAIATTLETAASLRSYPGPSRKFFYCWELNWGQHAHLGYEGLARIYRGIPLIARSEADRTILEDCWNTSVAAVIPDGDLEKFACEVFPNS